MQVAIVGTRNPSHIDDAITAADLELRGGVLAQIDEIMLAAKPTAGPTPNSV